MKIAHFINTFPGYHSRVGGGEQAALRLIRKLSQAGVENEVYTGKFDSSGGEEGFRVKSLPVIEDYAGPLKKYIEVLKWYVAQFDPLVFAAVFIALVRSRPDVVHMHNMYKLTFAPLAAAKLLRVPVCISIYDYWHICPLSTLTDFSGADCRRFHGAHCVPCLPKAMKTAQKALLYLRKMLFRIFMNAADCFVVLSDSSRRILKEYGIPEWKISLVPVDIPQEFSGQDDTPSAPDRGSILFVGWMQKRKGLLVLLNAMEKVWKRIPEAKLIMITQEVKWENEYKLLVEEKLADFDRGKYVLKTGQLRRDEIKKLIRQASLIVVPEQWENMSPLLVIEAMFMGKALIAADTGGIPEFVQDGFSGLLFERNDPGMLADKITVLLKDDATAARLGANARERIIEIAGNAAPDKKMLEVYSKL